MLIEVVVEKTSDRLNPAGGEKRWRCEQSVDLFSHQSLPPTVMLAEAVDGLMLATVHV